MSTKIKNIWNTFLIFWNFKILISNFCEDFHRAYLEKFSLQEGSNGKRAPPPPPQQKKKKKKKKIKKIKKKNKKKKTKNFFKIFIK